jgi:hypothetical protein
MAYAIAIGAAVILLSAAGCGVLMMIAVSIHKVDRSKNLTGQPCTHIDAATRRVLVGQQPLRR